MTPFTEPIPNIQNKPVSSVIKTSMGWFLPVKHVTGRRILQVCCKQFPKCNMCHISAHSLGKEAKK